MLWTLVVASTQVGFPGNAAGSRAPNPSSVPVLFQEEKNTLFEVKCTSSPAIELPISTTTTEVHWPAWQGVPPSHTRPQVPQLFESLVSAVSQPFWPSSS